MRSKLMALAAAVALSLGSLSPGIAGSVTQPGETVGIAAGAPLPPGHYFVNTLDWGCRDRDGDVGDLCLGVDIPVLAWSTPWQIYGGRVQFLVATPVIEAGIAAGPNNDAFYTAGWYNPLAAVQLAWDLGGGWGFSYLIGVYFEVDAGTAFSSSSLNQRFAVSYTANKWNLTANLIWGTHFDTINKHPQLSPCPANIGDFACNPDFINLDLTATKKFGKWELGPVAFGSWDVSNPVRGFPHQNQFAVGGLVGYDFGPVTLQAYVTTDVTQTNYDGYDTRLWTRIIVPLSELTPPAEVSKQRY
jgi:Putative MetA-pathway of phenol degradation